MNLYIRGKAQGFDTLFQNLNDIFMFPFNADNGLFCPDLMAGSGKTGNNGIGVQRHQLLVYPQKGLAFSAVQ